MDEERAVRHVVHRDAVESVDRLANVVGVIDVAGIGGDVHRDPIGLGFDEVEGSDDAARLADDCGDAPDRGE